jgi:hypothetical protein
MMTAKKPPGTRPGSAPWYTLRHLPHTGGQVAHAPSPRVYVLFARCAFQRRVAYRLANLGAVIATITQREVAEATFTRLSLPAPSKTTWRGCVTDGARDRVRTTRKLRLLEGFAFSPLTLPRRCAP